MPENIQTQPTDYDRGFQHGIKSAVSWLHAHADEMNDGNAYSLLHLAADNIGREFKNSKRFKRPEVKASGAHSSQGER